MTQEEKAKRYDEAIERARQFSEKPYLEDSAGIVEYIFPELKESEDEKIRKLLVEAVTQVLQDQYCSNRGVSKEKVIAWLERQGEQNLEWSKEENDKISNIVAWIKDYPRLAKFNEEAFVRANNYAEWLKSIRNKYIPQKQGEQKPARSEEDEKLVKNLISTLSNLYARNLIKKETKEKYTNWLKSFKDRVQPQSKQEWSEEDEDKMQIIINIIKDSDPDWEELINWLKSLRPQNTWKPSDEQMNNK